MSSVNIMCERTNLWNTPNALSQYIARLENEINVTFMYDEWNPIAEYAGTTLEKSYTWGMDLSGTMQGAGGVGGLLSVNNDSESYYPTYDGNGNVSEYLENDSSNVTLVAHYEYDTFGRTVMQNGVKANDFDHRFSTKQLDVVSWFYYYGYRYNDPVTGRWPSRDPIGEVGGVNLYNMVGNDTINKWDLLGLQGRKRVICCGGKKVKISPRQMCCVGGSLKNKIPRWQRDCYSSAKECAALEAPDLHGGTGESDWFQYVVEEAVPGGSLVGDSARLSSCRKKVCPTP